MGLALIAELQLIEDLAAKVMTQEVDLLKELRDSDATPPVTKRILGEVLNIAGKGNVSIVEGLPAGFDEGPD